MSFKQVEVAHLNHEQVEELNVLENKLGVTLVAYEDLLRATTDNPDDKDFMNGHIANS